MRLARLPFLNASRPLFLTDGRANEQVREALFTNAMLPLLPKVAENPRFQDILSSIFPFW
jgi:hypothetical protein